MTIVEYFARVLEAPENQPGVRKFERFCGGPYRAFNDFFAEIDKQTASLPPSLGYEPWLKTRGTNATVARLMARILVERGKRIETEEKQKKGIVDAIRFLALPRTSRPAVSRRVRFLLEVWDRTHFLQEFLDGKDIDASEFIGLLKAYVSGDTNASYQLTQTAAKVQFSLRCGPKIGMESAAHESFLEFVVKVVEPGTYTWNDLEGTYTDPITEATRREFGNRRFNPQSAYRRLRKRSVST